MKTWIAYILLSLTSFKNRKLDCVWLDDIEAVLVEERQVYDITAMKIEVAAYPRYLKNVLATVLKIKVTSPQFRSHKKCFFWHPFYSPTSSINYYFRLA
jgi:hypothetical protein